MSYFLMFNVEMELMDEIAKNLKVLRESYELSQAKFAAKCGLLQRPYNRLENAESIASLGMLEKIAAKTDLEVWQLLIPNLNPSNPPVLKLATAIEETFYKSSGKPPKSESYSEFTKDPSASKVKKPARADNQKISAKEIKDAEPTQGSNLHKSKRNTVS